MIYNPLFFSNPYYKRSLNSRQYVNSYTNKYSNGNFNNYSNNFVTGYGNNYYNNYSNNIPNNYNSSYSNNYYKKNDFPLTNTNHHNNSETNTEKKVSKEEHIEPELFEIFGIKLYFDDILLICLIFFLYNEGVKDQYLFISLILLLLT